MASKPAPDSLLGLRSRAASARFFLVLAVAGALLFGGCGGSSDSASTASEPGSSSTVAETHGGKSTSSSSSSRAKAGKGEGGGSTDPAPSVSSQAKSKQGPRIRQPKGEQEHAATPEELEQATIADMALSSPDLPQPTGSTSPLPAAYTCKGKGTWPTLTWQGTPSNTKELILFAMSLQPAQGKVVFDWGVAGIDPTLSEISSGRLPKGVVVGRNSFGHTDYEICPQGAETYFFALFALPEKLSPGKGFDAAALRERVLDISGNVGLLPVGYGG